jgi:FkbM family methyltransferase
MGTIDTSDLFGIDELIIFSYYLSNAAIYRKTLDLGANLGLHSIMMSRCGFNVTAFEPDPIHQEILLANLSLNDIHNVTLQRAAISDKDGIAEFIRVRGNTTGSHLAGAKSNPYGDLDRFEVEVKAIGPFATKVDFAKMDVEGHEINVINGIQQETWDRLDILMECGSFDNACSLFDLSRSLNIKLYSQKIGWDCVNAVSDLPTSHHEGSVILTRKERLNW